MSEQQGSKRDGSRRDSIRETLERAESLEELRGTPGETSGRSERLSEDELFEVLYNSRRRTVLKYLFENGASTTGDIAEHIAALENDTTVQRLSSSERKRVYVGLYQNHLPMMDDVGALDYDKNRGTVQLRACSKQFEPYLDSPERPDESPLVAGCALACSSVPFLSLLDVAPVAGVGAPLWIVVGAIGFFLLALLDARGSIT